MKFCSILCSVFMVQSALLMRVPGVVVIPNAHGQDAALALNETRKTTTRTRLYLGAGVENSELDDGDDGFTVFVGYHFFLQMSLEAAYVDLGDFPFEGTVGESSVSGDEEVDGFSRTPVV